ncbi:MAG: hypothetical protein H0U75_02100 [Legionella sp.]|nr:hypothetical protein [Legionella sp.]
MQDFETAILSLETRLDNDYIRKHLSREKLLMMRKSLGTLKFAIRDMDFEKINSVYQALYIQCQYTPALKSKWTILGNALGIFIGLSTLTLLTIMTAGTTTPLWLWLTVISSSGTLGSVFGYKIAAFKTKCDIDTVFYKSFEYLSDTGQIELALKLITTLPRSHRLFSGTLKIKTKNLEALELDNYSSCITV